MINVDEGWDKVLTVKLLQMGLTHEQAGMVVGVVAEERMNADAIGYGRGYNDGYANGENDGYRRREIEDRDEYASGFADGQLLCGRSPRSEAHA